MNYKNSLLEKIVDSKSEEISASKFRESFASLRSRVKDLEPTRDLLPYFDPKLFRNELPQTRMIAEIKKASPSAGLIRPDFDPVNIARIYLESGAVALSVLTDSPFFQGSLKDLQSVRKISHRPILRKDFMIDPYQMYEARVYGADCVLAIVAILEKQQLVDLAGLAVELQMNVLIEVHNKEELDFALQVKEEKVLYGINNRNLKNLKIDLKTTEELIPFIPKDRVVISESGISERKQIEHLEKVGAKGFLIGETFLKSPDLKKKFKELANAG